MLPQITRNGTAEFQPPNGWDNKQDGHCGTLSVRVESIGRRVYHVSTWKPTDEELARLVKGAVIELRCVGVQPPVALDVLE